MTEIIKDRDGLLSIEKDWKNSAIQHRSPLQSYDWFLSCASAFGENGSLRIFIAREKDRISAVAPLVQKNRGIFRSLEIIGASPLGEPCDLLYQNPDSLTEIIDAVFHHRCSIYFSRIPAESALLEILPQTVKKRGILIQRESAQAAYVPIKGRWEDFSASLSSKRRYDIRRARRKADQFGQVSFAIFCPEPGELDVYLKTAFMIEASGWKGRQGSALLASEKLNRFFTSYIPLAAKKGILLLGFLNIDENAAATLIGVVYQGKLWVLKIGYDEKYAKCSPGILLVNETIRYAFEHNLKSYEFLGSDEPWLRMWTKDNFRRYKSFGYYPYNHHGIGMLCSDILHYAAAKVKLKTALKKWIIR